MMYEKNGLQLRSWDDLVERDGVDTLNRIAPNCDYGRPDLPPELRAEMEELYPPADWAPLWQLEERRSFLFDRVINVAAYGDMDPAEVVSAFASKEGLLELRENAKILLRRRKVRAEFRRLRIATRGIEPTVPQSS